MLKTMCNALSVFFLIFVSLIFYTGPLVYRDIEFLTVPSKALYNAVVSSFYGESFSSFMVKLSQSKHCRFYAVTTLIY